jgi:serine/threonine protein phosphatase PrpC
VKEKAKNLYPLYVLQQAFKRVTAVGSSTALIGVLNKQHLHFANLGDSGFVFYRQQDCRVVQDTQ